jgi:tRNA (mo5U34)-methyltransferase
VNRIFDPGPLRAQRWFHTIDLPDGTCTPGVFDTRASAARLDWPSVRGARCLDIGTCDGFWAFEMERRGAAEVVAIDIDDPGQLDLPRVGREETIEGLRKSFARRKERFELAAAALSSRVRRIPSSVFDLDAATHGTFDVVFCGSLLIHVREPVRALESMARVCSGEIMILEGVDARLDLPWRATPCARLEPAPMQWWRANTAGLLAMLRLAGYDVVSTSRHFLTPNGPGLYFPHPPSRPLSRANAWVRTRLAATNAPFMTRALGLAFGTYDVSVRARPRAPVTSSRA